MRLGAPWGLLWAAVCLLGVEAYVRAQPPERIIPYGHGILEYYAVADYLDALGPAEICFIGSSRTREGIVVSDVKAALAERLGRSFRVANYACAAASAEQMSAIVKQIVRHGRPELIVYGMTPQQVLGTRLHMNRTAVFWDIEDWWQEYQRHPERARDYLHEVIRREIGQFYHTLKYRAQLRNSLHENVAIQPGVCPILGEPTRWHKYEGELSHLVRDRRDHVQRVRAYVNRFRARGDFRRTGQKIEYLEQMIRACEQGGVPLVWVEAPMSRLLRQHLPSHAYPAFREIVERLAREHGVPFVPIEVIGVEIEDHEWREHSHMNLLGARKYTAALLDRVLIPFLEHGRIAGAIR